MQVNQNSKQDNILAIESVNKGFSLFYNGELFNYATSDKYLNPAENLALCVEEVTAGLDNINKIITSKGAGSLTGVRIPLAYLEGVRLVKSTLEIYSVDSLQAVFARLNKSRVALDARRGFYSLAEVNDEGEVASEELATKIPAEFELFEDKINAKDIYNFYINHPKACSRSLEPIYFRPPDAVKTS